MTLLDVGYMHDEMTFTASAMVKFDGIYAGL
jgi:hypothetical protein